MRRHRVPIGRQVFQDCKALMPDFHFLSPSDEGTGQC
jgi:hypothetical protein